MSIIFRAILYGLMSFIGSCGAWLVMNGFVAKRIIRRGINGYIEQNPEEFEQISGKLAYNFIRSAIDHLHTTYKESPEQVEQALKPVTVTVISKVKDHLFSAQGVANKKAHKEADEIEGEIVEQATGGMISSKLLEDHPIIGSLIQQFANNPEFLEQIKDQGSKGSSGGLWENR